MVFRKTSSQALMLGILLGLVAWVVDAWAGSLLFPGRGFLAAVVEPEPGHTLYPRSIMVAFLFLFGVVSGRLIARIEASEGREKNHVTLLDGLRHVHGILVEETEPRSMVLRVCEVLTDRMNMESAWIALLDPDDHSLLDIAVSGADASAPALKPGTPAADFPDCLRKALSHDEVLLGELGVFDCSQCNFSPAHPYCRSLCARLAFEGRVFGCLTLGCLHPAMRGSEGLLFFKEMCEDLGHALARLTDARALRDQQSKLQGLYDHAPLGIFVITFGGRFLFLNPTLFDYVGLSVDTFPEELALADFFLDEPRREAFLCELRGKGQVTNFDAQWRRKDGSMLWLRFAARTTGKLDHGEEVIEGFAMDISAAKVVEAERSALQDKLYQAQKFESIAALAGGIAHEFNNILQAMMGSAYLAQLQVPEGSVPWQYLRDIQQSGTRASQHCDQMLTYAGKKAIMLRRVHPDESMHTLIPVCENLLPEKAKVLWHLEAPDVEIRADATSLKQLVLHLLRNAAESLGENSEGEIQISSRVRMLNATDLSRLTPSAFRRPGRYWILEVQDTGCGIAPEALPRVFDPFYTTKFPGRGMGLAAARGLAQSFDGGISVTSQPGIGSRFCVMIPVADEVAKAPVSDRSFAPSVKAAAFHGHGLIWIVDDEPLICQTVERVLTSWGFTVRSFTDGEVAARRFREQPERVSLLLLDVTMPHWSGPETLRHLRETDPSLRAVVMSGFDEEESLRHFEGQNVTGFIHKPFQIEHLQEKLRVILGESA